MRRRFILRSIVLIGLTGFCMQVYASQESKHRDRIEALFIWKVSDTLNLSRDEEKKLAEIVKKYADQKTYAKSEIDVVVGKAKSAKGDEAKKLADRYQKALKKYSSCQTDEFDQIKKEFGSEKLMKYLALKHEFTGKLKAFLSQSEKSQTSSRKTILKDPKIIED